MLHAYKHNYIVVGQDDDDEGRYLINNINMGKKHLLGDTHKKTKTKDDLTIFWYTPGG